MRFLLLLIFLLLSVPALIVRTRRYAKEIDPPDSEGEVASR